MSTDHKYRVLCILYYFPPVSVAAAQRAFNLLKYLNPDLFEVTVLVPKHPDAAYPFSESEQFFPNHLKVIKTWSPSLKFWRNMKATGMSSTSNRKAGALQKLYEKTAFPDKGVVWAYSAYLKAMELHRSEKFDCIFSSSPLASAHMSALRLKRKINIPWICEFRDFYFTHNSTLIYQRGKARKLESKILHEADRFLFVSSNMETQYRVEYPKIIGKTQTILSGVDPKEIETLLDSASKLPKNSGVKVIYYAGTFYNGLRDPLPFLTHFNQCIEEGLIHPDNWSIQIAGPIEGHLIESLKDLPVYACLDLLGPIPRHRALQYMSQADFFWLIVPDIDSHKDTIPAKLYEYRYFRKPVLAYIPPDSEVANRFKNEPGMHLIASDVYSGFSALSHALLANPQEIPPLSTLYQAAQMSQSFQHELLELLEQ